jgi:hypothetical protein
MGKWTVDWSNEADRGYELVLEFMEDDEYRARLELTSSDELVFTVYPSNNALQIPAALLASVIADGGPPLLASRKMVRERDREPRKDE